MNWLRQLLESRFSSRQVRVQRIVLLKFVGLLPDTVDLYLEQGLLHNLALLCDIGSRCAWSEAPPFESESLCRMLGGRGVPTRQLLPHAGAAPRDLPTICANDSQQQERLMAELARWRPGVVVATFDMPAQLCRLFGRGANQAQQNILRDVHARMDEIVGKAFSFLDERTMLLVLIKDDAITDHTRHLAPSISVQQALFCSARVNGLGGTSFDLLQLIFNLLVIEA